MGVVGHTSKLGCSIGGQPSHVFAPVLKSHEIVCTVTPPMNLPAAAAALRFGRFELQPLERRLLVAGEPALLGARALDLLLALADRPGELVDKHQLMDLVWPGMVVEENNLATQISALRKVLGGDVIATVPGRGYRFVVRLDNPPAQASAGPTPLAIAAPGLRTNLPNSLPPLLGRADDLATVGRLIEEHRLVSIVGAGGIGKTLLALHLLNARRDTYAHGVCWVELAQVGDAAALPGTIAAALGVRIGSGEPLAALLAAVAPLTLLLGLDNAEHMPASVAAVVAALHGAAPGLRLLVTSQAALKVKPECIYRIGALAVPPKPLPAAQALNFGAVALFADRVQAADTRFTLTDANAPTVIQLCRALDGQALAIELAAARVPLLGLQQLAASMPDRLKLLVSGHPRAAPARQQTLRAALDWSHGFLDPREQVVFRRLAVLAGSGSLHLIQQVVAEPDGAGGLDACAVLDGLRVLVDRSLVTMLPGDDPGQQDPRYRLLESPRAFALEQLARSGEEARIRQRHALALATIFDAAWDDLFRGDIGHEALIGPAVPPHRSGSINLANLVDAELAAGDAAAAARGGQALVAALAALVALEGTGDEYELAVARVNLVAALLALDACAPAQRVAQVGWLQAAALDLQANWADHLALLAALQGRLAAAAQLAGYADCIYRARGSRRDANEANAVDRARAIAQAGLGGPAYERLHAEGTTLRDDEIAALAFAAQP